jgi:hypothetical protein
MTGHAGIGSSVLVICETDSIERRPATRMFRYSLQLHIFTSRIFTVRNIRSIVAPRKVFLTHNISFTGKQYCLHPNHPYPAQASAYPTPPLSTSIQLCSLYVFLKKEMFDVCAMSKSSRWTWDTRSEYEILVQKPTANLSLVDPNIRGLTLRQTLRKWAMRMGGWMELAKDRVQWRALVLAVLNLLILLPELVN